MKKIKNLFKKPTTYIIMILLVVVVSLYFQTLDLKYNRLYQIETVPDIDLINTLNYPQKDGIFTGYASGFVVFNDINEQPKELKQYYTIRALTQFDDSFNQIFSLEESIKMGYIPLRILDRVELREVRDTNSSLILEDRNGTRFTVNKRTSVITMEDGDVELITNNLDYKNFIIKFLK